MRADVPRLIFVGHKCDLLKHRCLLQLCDTVRPGIAPIVILTVIFIHNTIPDIIQNIGIPVVAIRAIKIFCLCAAGTVTITRGYGMDSFDGRQRYFLIYRDFRKRKATGSAVINANILIRSIIVHDKFQIFLRIG